MTDVDAIIVGGGHNGLVCAGYLARAGLDVLVLERRPFVGGACVTEELFPGYRLSSCAYICHLLQAKVIDELELRRHGFDVHHLDPGRFQPFPDGRGLLVWDDVARTQDSLAQFSKRDADSFPRWLEFWERAAGILYPHFLRSPPTTNELMTAVRSSGDEAFFRKLLTVSMSDVVESFFESPQAHAAFIQAQDVGDPSAPGSAWCYTHIRCDVFSRPEDVGIVKGGMGGITTALARSAEANGATLRTDAPIERILVEDQRACGVRLSGGEEVRSRLVVSNADPKRTFLNLISPAQLPDVFRQNTRNLKTDAAYLKFHAALKRLPDFTRYFGEEFDPRFLANIKICPSTDYFARSWQDACNGHPSRTPVMEVQIPSVYDTTLAPAGHHVLSAWVLYAPVRLKEGSWKERNREVGEQLVDVLCEYAPDFRECLLDWVLYTPKELEERVALTDGNIRHLDIIPRQFLAERPFQGWAGYRTPICDLYLCGAGTHPGGEVTAAPGHNAARVILEDWRA